MANQGPNTGSSAQSQMSREWDNQASNIQNQGQANFLEETGTHVKNMAQGASDVGKGAVLGAASLARGAASGAANVAQGAADVIKNTFGMNTNHPSTTTTQPNTVNIDMDYPTKPSHPHTPNL